jgi:hypothetical protein
MHAHPADQDSQHSPAAKCIATAKQTRSSILGLANASQLLISDSNHNGFARHKHHQSA